MGGVTSVTSLTLPIQINIKLLKRMEKTKMSKILKDSRFAYMIRRIKSAGLNREILFPLNGLIHAYYDGERCDDKYIDFEYSKKMCQYIESTHR